jgi:hypothetical protein
MSDTAVYYEPFIHLRKTVKLFRDYPSVAASVRRIWFNGFYVAETDNDILEIVRYCVNLQSATVPWTTARRGNTEEWSHILGKTKFSNLRSLEFLMVDPKQSHMTSAANLPGLGPHASDSIDFSCLSRLKIFGNSQFLPIADEDLQHVAKSATRLEELHITGNSSISVDGMYNAD